MGAGNVKSSPSTTHHHHTTPPMHVSHDAIGDRGRSHHQKNKKSIGGASTKHLTIEKPVNNTTAATSSSTFTTPHIFPHSPHSPSTPSKIWSVTCSIHRSFICRFCGGSGCKHEDYTRQELDKEKGEQPPLIGLHSTFISANVIGMQRPSTRLIREHNIIAQFKKHNITAVINLQLAGEHPHCGDGIHASGFSYHAEDFTDHGIYYYNPGWIDMNIPSLEKMIHIVQIMQFHSDRMRSKVAVHCHAGYGRTGIAIACFFIYSYGLTAEDAIKSVRDRRKGSIQTKKQQSFIHEFYEYLKYLRTVFPSSSSSPSSQQHQHNWTNFARRMRMIGKLGGGGGGGGNGNSNMQTNGNGAMTTGASSSSHSNSNSPQPPLSLQQQHDQQLLSQQQYDPPLLGVNEYDMLDGIVQAHGRNDSSSSSSSSSQVSILSQASENHPTNNNNNNNDLHASPPVSFSSSGSPNIPRTTIPRFFPHLLLPHRQAILVNTIMLEDYHATHVTNFMSTTAAGQSSSSSASSSSSSSSQHHPHDESTSLTLHDTLSRQRLLLHGPDRTDYKHIPKFISLLCTRLKDLAIHNPDLLCVAVVEGWKKGEVGVERKREEGGEDGGDGNEIGSPISPLSPSSKHGTLSSPSPSPPQQQQPQPPSRYTLLDINRAFDEERDRELARKKAALRAKRLAEGGGVGELFSSASPSPSLSPEPSDNGNTTTGVSSPAAGAPNRKKRASLHEKEKERTEQIVRSGDNGVLNVMVEMVAQQQQQQMMKGSADGTAADGTATSSFPSPSLLSLLGYPSSTNLTNHHHNTTSTAHHHHHHNNIDDTDNNNNHNNNDFEPTHTQNPLSLHHAMTYSHAHAMHAAGSMVGQNMTEHDTKPPANNSNTITLPPSPYPLHLTGSKWTAIQSDTYSDLKRRINNGDYVELEKCDVRYVVQLLLEWLEGLKEPMMKAFQQVGREGSGVGGGVEDKKDTSSGSKEKISASNISSSPFTNTLLSQLTPLHTTPLSLFQSHPRWIYYTLSPILEILWFVRRTNQTELLMRVYMRFAYALFHPPIDMPESLVVIKTHEYTMRKLLKEKIDLCGFTREWMELCVKRQVEEAQKVVSGSTISTFASSSSSASQQQQASSRQHAQNLLKAVSSYNYTPILKCFAPASSNASGSSSSTSSISTTTTTLPFHLLSTLLHFLLGWNPSQGMFLKLLEADDRFTAQGKVGVKKLERPEQSVARREDGVMGGDGVVVGSDAQGNKAHLQLQPDTHHAEPTATQTRFFHLHTEPTKLVTQTQNTMLMKHRLNPGDATDGDPDGDEHEHDHDHDPDESHQHHNMDEYDDDQYRRSFLHEQQDLLLQRMGSGLTSGDGGVGGGDYYHNAIRSPHHQPEVSTTNYLYSRVHHTQPTQLYESPQHAVRKVQTFPNVSSQNEKNHDSATDSSNGATPPVNVDAGTPIITAAVPAGGRDKVDTDESKMSYRLDTYPETSYLMAESSLFSSGGGGGGRKKAVGFEAGDGGEDDHLENKESEDKIKHHTSNTAPTTRHPTKHTIKQISVSNLHMNNNQTPDSSSPSPYGAHSPVSPPAESKHSPPVQPQQRRIVLKSRTAAAAAQSIDDTTAARASPPTPIAP